MQVTELDAPVTDVPVSLSERMAADDVRFVLAMVAGPDGRPRAKLVPADAVEEGVRVADRLAVPDPSSYMPLHAVRPGLAMVHCDPRVDGEPWPYAPRAILRAQLDRLAGRGLTARVGAEAEYLLVRRDGEGAVAVADERNLTRVYDHLAEVSAALDGLGWAGTGRFEPAEPLATADRLVMFRYLVQVLAERRGMTATFMASPFAGRTATGLSLALSLWRDGEPLFPDRDGMSPLAYGFAGGLLAHAPALSAIVAPTVNSYKRTAPARATWSEGGTGTGHHVRMGGDRIVVRLGDGSADPYLATAVLLAAGLDGVDAGIDPRVGEGPELPPTLLHAVDELAADEVVRTALDAAGAGVADRYRKGRREEFLAWQSQVTGWEIDRYLTAF